MRARLHMNPVEAKLKFGEAQMTETIDTAALAKLATTMFEACAICAPSQRGRMLEYFTAEQWRALAALLRGVVDGREAWECERCGRLSYRPEGDLRTMQANGYVGCCPERKLRAVRVVFPSPPLSTTKEG